MGKGYTTSEAELSGPSEKKAPKLVTPNHSKPTDAAFKKTDPKKNALGSPRIQHRGYGGINPWEHSKLMAPPVPQPPPTLNMTSFPPATILRTQPNKMLDYGDNRKILFHIYFLIMCKLLVIFFKKKKNLRKKKLVMFPNFVILFERKK